MRNETTREKRKWLSDARKHRKLTATQVAERAGISRSHYSMIENNLREPSLKVAALIAAVLKVDVKQFFN